MKKSIVVLSVVFGAGALALLAADPEGFHLWTGSELRSFDKKLASKMNEGKIANEPLGKFGNHSVSVIHREGSGEAELHEKQADVMIIESGDAVIIVGGTIPDSKTTAANEVRGPKVEGGERKKLTPGAIVHIPAKMPHQMLLEPGKQITYAIVKIDSE
ncbi:MAG: hypothetical protein ACR2I2_06765 [Bryobacteraceae bacterium]